MKVLKECAVVAGKAHGVETVPGWWHYRKKKRRIDMKQLLVVIVFCFIVGGCIPYTGPAECPDGYHRELGKCVITSDRHK